MYNYANNKQLNQLTRPLALVISGTYTTPRTPGDGAAMRVVSQVVRDWQLGWVLRYQSGALLQTPSATTNQLSGLLLRNQGFNPGTNLDNPTGANPLNVDPNSKSFDPTTQQLLNPAAWSEPATGQWGGAAPFYSDYRWQRQPSEAMSFARNFRMGKEGKYNLQIRAEFQNVLNRHFYAIPATGIPSFFTFSNLTAAPSRNTAGIITGGYGTINTTTNTGAGAIPRSGQAVIRFNF